MGGKPAFHLFRFPIHVRPGFLMFMALVVFVNPNEFGFWLAGSAAALTLMHELGHAFAARATGAEAEISLDLLTSQLDEHGLTPPRDGTFLFTGGHYRRTFPREEYVSEYPGLGKEAAEYLYRECGVVNDGQDAPSIEAGGNAAEGTFPCHVLCRELQRHNTENLANIEEVAGREFTYCGLPLKIRDGTGSPIRAVAILGLDG